MKRPYWSLIPPLMKAHNCFYSERDYDAYLSVMPNNPDNFVLPIEDFVRYAGEFKERHIPFIHDSVYYNPIYYPNAGTFPTVGNVSIYSFSKSFGISSLRLGYAVCPDTEFYNLMLEYMEMMTVGTSIAAQEIGYDLLQDIENNKEAYNSFIKQAQNSLFINKALIKTVPKHIIEVPDNFEYSNGMFGWFKCPDISIFERHKICIADGKFFGQDGFVRINLAIPNETMIEVVRRLSK
jgi:aspartate/methionine/tyrosine aminotransferase